MRVQSDWLIWLHKVLVTCLSVPVIPVPKNKGSISLEKCIILGCVAIGKIIQASEVLGETNKTGLRALIFCFAGVYFLLCVFCGFCGFCFGFYCFWLVLFIYLFVLFCFVLEWIVVLLSFLIGFFCVYKDLGNPDREKAEILSFLEFDKKRPLSKGLEIQHLYKIYDTICVKIHLFFVTHILDNSSWVSFIQIILLTVSQENSSKVYFKNAFNL